MIEGQPGYQLLKRFIFGFHVASEWIVQFPFAASTTAVAGQ